MPGVVVDASAVVELLLRTDAGAGVDRELRAATAAAPAHLDAEVLSALGRLARGRDVTERSVGNALKELARAPIARYPLAPLLQEAWSLRKNLSLHDAIYVALARRLNYGLVTTDVRLAQAPNLGISITVVSS